uniref:Uncharacterized protein n=2 Tax=Mycobacterium riyadhense TaxID=486698 RepID=A0A653F2F2_9MYCO|nr:hypothetical protein BIN_B_05326 [Mycobacterium riyadhense]
MQLDDDHPFFLVPLAELVAEGFGKCTYGNPIDHLANQLGDAVLFDDIGRRAVTRATAASLFAERAAKEAAQREASRRRVAEQKAAREARRAAIQAERAREAQQAPRHLSGNAFADVVEYDPERW